MTNRKRTSQEASERSNDPYEEKLTRKYTDSLTKDDGVSKIIKSYSLIIVLSTAASPS